MDKTLKINKTNLGLFFLLFPYFNPIGLKYIPALVSVYDAIQLWKLCACLYIWFLYFRKNRLSKSHRRSNKRNKNNKNRKQKRFQRFTINKKYAGINYQSK